MGLKGELTLFYVVLNLDTPVWRSSQIKIVFRVVEVDSMFASYSDDLSLNPIEFCKLHKKRK